MKVELLYEDGHSSVEYIAIPFKVGKTKEMDLALKSWRVSKHHATFIRKEGDYYVEDHGSLSGTLLNGNRIAMGGPLKRRDEIIIGPCLIRILEVEEPESQDDDAQIISSTDRLKECIQPHFGDIEKAKNAQYLQHHQRLHAALLEALELRKRDITTLSDSALRVDADKLLSRIIEEDTQLDEQIDRQVLKQIILDEAVGLGALEPLLKDQSITEIMVNKFDEIYIERAGRLMQSQATFSSEKAVLSIIERIVSPIGRRIDESSPMVDARLADGSRVNAIIPPIALKGASLTIRKFTQHRPQIAELIQSGTLDNCMAEFLQLCIEHKKNVIVSGGTGSGKTTLLNILSHFIPNHERIITIEDAAELRLNHHHLVSLESRPANNEGKGTISIRDLVRNALRMRPDRIIVGECRGAEAFDMLGAMNTGHEGSLTTLHANSPRDALSRLETMIMMADMDLPLTAIREQISNSVHFIVQQARLPSGRRVISSITEIGGMESGVIKTQEIFSYDKSTQRFIGKGILPACFEQLRQDGSIQLSPLLFTQSSMAI